MTDQEELNRCIPCCICGESPTFLTKFRTTTLGCKEVNAAGCMFVWCHNLTMKQSRQKWNRAQRRSDVRWFGNDKSWSEACLIALEKYPKTELSDESTSEELQREVETYKWLERLTSKKLREQVAAHRAHAHKLGIIAEARKEKIKILNEEISRLKADLAKACQL